MRGGRSLTVGAAAIEYIPDTFAQPLALRALFREEHAPLEVDLGCGDGSLLAALAAQRPDRNFLGIEQMIGRVRSSCRRIDRLGLTNARIMRAEVATTVRLLLPRGSVDVFHLMFPDPWPKRRHHRRRLFTREFLEPLGAALKPHGLVHIATDQRDYFKEMLQTVRDTHLFSECDATAPGELPRSTFEERFLQTGDDIHRLLLRKLSG